MFEDSLVESTARLAPRNPWTTAFSFTFEMVVAGVLVLLPLIHTEALPKWQLTSFLEVPQQPMGTEHKTLTRAATVKQSSEFVDNVLRPPREVPRNIPRVSDEEPSPPSLPGVPGSTGPSDGTKNPIVEAVVREVPPMPKPDARQVPVSSGVAEGLLIHQVTPQYPPLARQARIQGTVILQAVIGKDGTVQNLRQLSGHPMLVPAAMEAVKQWRYKPYYLNGEPVEVDTQINVNFTMSGG